MALVEVKFKPTDAMPSYQGACPMIDPATDKQVKPLIIMQKAGAYQLPRDKAAQLCHDFPDNFSCSEKLDWTDSQFAGGTIYLQPGTGVPDHNRRAKAPEVTK